MIDILRPGEGEVEVRVPKYGYSKTTRLPKVGPVRYVAGSYVRRIRRRGEIDRPGILEVSKRV
jgi:hypothetical protein